MYYTRIPSTLYKVFMVQTEAALR